MLEQYAIHRVRDLWFENKNGQTRSRRSMSSLVKFLAAYHRSELRGSTRVSDFLSQRVKSLQNVVLDVDGGSLHLDLRISAARGIIAGSTFESGEGDVMRKYVREGDVVFDIGAHFGLFTLLLAKLAGATGKVFAFEPNAELLPCLRRTLQPISSVELLEIGLSDANREADLYIPEDASMASFSDWTKGIAGDVHVVRCRMERLDDLVEEGRVLNPNFIKCDVEGAELSVFQGGERTLDREDGPVILFEANAAAARAFGSGPEDEIAFLQSLRRPRYQFFDVAVSGVTEISLPIQGFTNIVALPESRL